jgi:iron complex transport system substrate-binding protein
MMQCGLFSAIGRRFFMLLCVATSLAQAAVQVADERGVVVTFEKPPQRIVSVLPSLTESICALGACARLVGVDRYSNWPARVKSLPKVGGGLDLNIESIVALKPDVVLAATSSRVGERLQALGLKVLMFEPQKHSDVQRALLALGQMLEPQTAQDAGAANAQRVWREMDAGVQAAAQSLPANAKKSSVYFEVDRTPYAAGEASFIGETLARLGVRNIVPAALGAFPKINPEFVVRANPDVIILSARHAAELAQRPGWATLRAVKERRICELSAEQADVVVRSGPRMAEAAAVLAQCIARMAER